MKAIIIFFSLITSLFAQADENAPDSFVPIFENETLWFNAYKAQIEHASHYTYLERLSRRNPVGMFVRSGKPVVEALDHLVKEKILIQGKVNLTEDFTKEQRQSFMKLLDSITQKYGSLGAEMLGCGYIETSEMNGAEKQFTLHYKIPHDYHSILRQIEAGENLDKLTYPNTTVNESSTPRELWIAFLKAYSKLEFDYVSRVNNRDTYLVSVKLMIKTKQIITKSYPIHYYDLTPVQKLKFDEIQAPLAKKFGHHLSSEMLGMGITSYLNREHLTNKRKNMTVHLPTNEFEKADEILTSFLKSRAKPKLDPSK